MLGIGTVVGLPGLAYIYLFHKEDKSRQEADIPILPQLARSLTEQEATRLIKSAHKLVGKLERASLESGDMQTNTKSLNFSASVENDDDIMEPRNKSFSEFVGP